jgi:hypothetical protein
MRKLIYVAHKFGGDPENVRKVEAIILQLIKLYPDYTFYSPLHALGFYYFAKPYEEGMKDCIEMLDRCDELWLCNGWQKSNGCNTECEYFLREGRPIKYLEVNQHD